MAVLLLVIVRLIDQMTLLRSKCLSHVEGDLLRASRKRRDKDIRPVLHLGKKY